MKCHSSTNCVDCDVDVMEAKEYYMVTDSCWKRAGMESHGGMLCIGCLESRLGKKLTSRNFAECPLNWRNMCLPDYASPRLFSRLLGGKNSKWRKGAIELLDAALRGEKEVLEAKILLALG